MDILVVVAHPDDEVLGCGGTIAKWSKEGHDIHVLIMAEGATSRDKERNRSKRKDELYLLSESAQIANNILGVQSIKLLDFPDNRMDSVCLLDVVKVIEDFIDRLNPEIVLTHHSGDLNIDHQIIHRAVITATRPQPSNRVRRLLSFEIPSSTEWQSPTINEPFVANWFVDISDTLDQKIKALEAYQSEMRDWPHARSIKGVEHLAKLRGANIGLHAAEAFSLIRNIVK